MADSRRQKYYKRCQEIIDDLHERASNGGFVSDSECIERYGKSDYRAFVHELNLMNVKPDWRAMTTALEWMYHSQYFTNKANEEEAAKSQRRMVYISAGSAFVSALCSLALCICNFVMQNNEGDTATDHDDGAYYENKVDNDHEKRIEVPEADEIHNIARQTPAEIRNHEYGQGDTVKTQSK